MRHRLSLANEAVDNLVKYTKTPTTLNDDYTWIILQFYRQKSK